MSNQNTTPPGALELLEKVKTLDGAGSGLDADLSRGLTVKRLVYNHETASILYSDGISSVQDDGAGKITVSFSTPFANADWIMKGTMQQLTEDNWAVPMIKNGWTKLAGSACVNTTNGWGVEFDSPCVMLEFIGV